MRPFAMLAPVAVGGVTIKLATLHNEEDLRRKDIREGRGRDRAARRRRDPAGDLPRAARRRARAPPAAPAPARRTAPSAGPAPSSRATRSTPPAPTAPAPSARGSCSSTSSRAARWTSRGSARSRCACCSSEGLVQGPRRLLPPGRASVESCSSWRASPRSPCATCSRRSRNPSGGRSRACCSRWGSRRWGR